MDIDDGNIDFSVSQQDLEEALDPIKTGVKKRKNQHREKQIYGIWANSSGSEEDSVYSRNKKQSSRAKDYSTPVSFVNAETSESSHSKQRMHSMRRTNQRHNRSSSPLSRSKTKDIGGWEKYTKGFGSRMLEKMGYQQGQGLGLQGTGIIEPIKVQSIQGRVCLDSKDTGPSQRPEPPDEFLEEVKDKKAQKIDRWKKNRGRTEIERGSRFKSVSEVMELANKNPRHLNKPKLHSFINTERVGLKTKVINMTGPEYQEFDSLEEYVQKSGGGRSGGHGEVDFLPELVQNIDLLVDNTEINIVKLNRQIEYDSDMLVQLKYEQKELEVKKNESNNKLTRMTKLLLTLDMIEQRHLSGLIELDMCEQWFRDLLADFSVEYTQLRICLLAKPIVFPLIHKAIESWDPLNVPDDTNVLNLFETWRGLLDIEPLPSLVFPKGHSVYQHLLLEVWIPKFVSCLTSHSLRDPHPLIHLLYVWQKFFTPYVRSQLETVHILPALHNELGFWNPMEDTLPLHHWIHPWLPFLRHSMDSIFPNIRQKLSAALQHWHPSDPSAYHVIKPWNGVFSQGEFAAFLATAICPKLTIALQQLVIDPSNQKLEPFNDVMRWRDLLTISQIVDMFCHQFFPKWLGVLESWLLGSPDFHEVSRWYLGWKSMLDAELLACPPIQHNFLRALDLMNSLLQWTPDPSLRESLSNFTQEERNNSFHISPQPLPPLPTPELTFKDLLQKYALRDDILYIPLNKQGPNGNFLYKFGTFTIYIEKNVIFTAKGPSWLPISIDELLTSCH
ncbi:Tuftelin-interacting protein 11-like [Oopsacas minuta]|uniref:Tuftelin-interacting protein 11-like n=1 Tax=Oopsacas minuta TaxID=111878 RepID=A0AAV7JKS8_9METZ|nr:Tuftelin-interacting protein 11-like [Oopsacas minuta]